MRFITETLSEKSNALIISKEEVEFTKILKAKLKQHHAEVFVAPHLPKDITPFSYLFIVNPNELLSAKLLADQKVILIFLNQNKLPEQIIKKSKNLNIKIISAAGLIKEEHIDRILWFSFSQTKENFFSLLTSKKHLLTKKKSLIGWFEPITLKLKKNFTKYLIILIVLIHFLFLMPLILSGILLYRNISLDTSDAVFQFGKKLYQIVRPTYLLFSLALPIDNIIDAEEKSIYILKTNSEEETNVANILELIFQKNKSDEEKNILDLRIRKLAEDIDNIETDLNFILEKIPSNIGFLKESEKKLESYSNLLANLKRLIPFLGKILGKGEKKYLLLFANNRELRPGGGFIGSFAVMIFRDSTFADFKIYDVYDADGQLVEHVEPPEPIRRFLNQPNWFLRDSAFSPDFLENYVQAKYFLEKEMKFSDFSGALLLTTSAIENIIEPFDEVFLPDFNEFVNKENFYIKAQIYSEKDFFPGSTKKKNFLASLTRQILLNINKTSTKDIGLALKKSLDEKQMVMIFEDSEIQKVLDSFYWSGRVIYPRCPTAALNCIPDFIFPIDANLGVNKANFFINRTMDLEINIDSDGVINHKFSIQFKNDSTEGIFPGGTYKNYFQLYLPKNAVITTITKDGTLVEDYTEKNEEFKKIGFFLEIKPKNILDLIVKYKLPDTVLKGNNYYQLVIQKQIGSSNSDLSLRFNLTKNIHLINQNFSALVKDNQILYNTSLSADKIFTVELIKE